jgi:hypothetical protein
MKALEYWIVLFSKGDDDPMHKYLFAVEKDAIQFRNSMKSKGYIAEIERTEEFV